MLSVVNKSGLQVRGVAVSPVYSLAKQPMEVG